MAAAGTNAGSGPRPVAGSLARPPSREPASLIADLTTCGATQSHVARILNVSEASVSRWANGTRNPSPYTLRRLSNLHRDLTAWDRTDTEQVAS